MSTSQRVACLALFLTRLCAAQGHEMMRGDSTRWHSSADATVYLQFVQTSGTRSAYQFGSVNNGMLEARGPWAGGVLRARAMASIEPVTLTERGAPELLQGAFTSRGTTITDHAHPSPWIMELAVAWERSLGAGLSASVYGAAVGEPALGPPVYLHRASAFANPVVPLGHHTEDGTHVSFGVITLGVAERRVRLEASAFNDRHPDDPNTLFFYRGARLDAYAGRASFTAGGWNVSTSYGYLPATGGGHNHGALHQAGVALVRDADPWFVTAVYGVNRPLDGAASLPAVLVEAEHRSSAGHVVFARAEYVKRSAEELALVGSVGPTQSIGAFEAGYARAFAALAGTPVRLAASTTLNVIPAALAPFYGGRMPLSLSVYGQYSWDSGDLRP